MRLVIAGGGTGGHLFPALAVARAVRAEEPEADILFVGTEHGLEARLIPKTEFPIRFISARGMRGTGITQTIKGAALIPWGVVQSVSILRKYKPDIVLGVGGYASGPTLAAALLMGIPTAIQEQNSVMGTTNRILAKLVGTVFTAWEQTEPMTDPEKTIVAGNPIRSELVEVQREDSATVRDDQRLHVLVFGGSQGARSINLAVSNNIDQLGDETNQVALIHQTGRDWIDDVRDAYALAGFDADVREFIDDMGSVYEWADLVVCRAGASSLAEITALGKPAILVPYPYAIGDHQAKNAAVLERNGAAKVIPDSKLQNGALVNVIRKVAENRKLLAEMSINSRKLGRPEAARTIALELLKHQRSVG
jgi:UDP-N-acetylglucosamine--N-acetylmuramyl-(pentapeptide) pyrophosphoryl-undecaprenol N-acetylglucosamine transferase